MLLKQGMGKLLPPVQRRHAFIDQGYWNEYANRGKISVLPGGEQSQLNLLEIIYVSIGKNYFALLLPIIYRILK